MSSMLVSVVIPTFRRTQLLVRCLRSLLIQDLDARCYEIVIVDDGHDDKLRQLIEAYARGSAGAPQIRYLEPMQGRGPAVARNCGWRAAAGAIIAFTDDDTVPEVDWLSHGLTALRHHADCSAVSGRICVPRAGTGLPTDHERMTQCLERAPFATANAFVRREALACVNGFDERFECAWLEDSDLRFRLMARVGPVGRCGHAVVLHPVRAEPWGISLRQQRNNYFDALLFREHPVQYKEQIDVMPPWSHYLIVGVTAAVPMLLLAEAHAAAATAGLLIVAMWLQLALRRLWHTSRSPKHVAEMLFTSAVIPFLSVYWRLRGAIHFRVMFL